MKLYKFALPLMLAALLAVFVACGDDDDSTPAATTAPATTAAAESAFSCDGDHPGTEPDASAFPMDVTDDNGASVTIDTPPLKIASLDAAHTEVLYAIGAGDQVTAVDNTSDCPAEAAALDARIDAFSPSVEAITALQPDLVILGFVYQSDIGSALRNAGLTVLTLTAPASINDTFDQIELIGKVTGHVDQADALVTSMASQVHAIESSVAGKTAPKVYHELDNTYFSVGPGSFIEDMYTTLGAENIADATGESYPQLSAEAIIAADPDVIILADEAAGETADTVAARPGWSAVNAVKNDRIYSINPDIISRAGPRIVDALQQLATDLYPEPGG